MKRIFAFLLLFPLLALRADEPGDWEAAETAYRSGNYPFALECYQDLRLRQGTSPALEFNIGNTLMRLNRIPEAIAAYRRAQWLDPHDSDITTNLERARDLKQAQLPALPLSRRAAGILSPQTWQTFAVVMAWMLGLTGISRRWVPSLRTASLWILPLATGLLLVSAAGVYAMGPEALNREAVANSETLTTRFEPLEDATEHFSVSGGSVVEVLEHSRGWSRIRVDDKTGWVPAPDLIPVGFE